MAQDPCGVPSEMARRRSHEVHARLLTLAQAARRLPSAQHDVRTAASVSQHALVRADRGAQKQSMAELKLRRLTDHNVRLGEDLARQRVRISEASARSVSPRSAR